MTTTIDDSKIIDRLGYEVAVQREMLEQARRCARLECAVQSAIHALVALALPSITDESTRAQIRARVETLKRALAEKEI